MQQMVTIPFLLASISRYRPGAIAIAICVHHLDLQNIATLFLSLGLKSCNFFILQDQRFLNVNILNEIISYLKSSSVMS